MGENNQFRTFETAIADALSFQSNYQLINRAQLPSCFPISYFAASVFGAVGGQISELIQRLNLVNNAPEIVIDQSLASLWFGESIHPIGWRLPQAWDSIAGDYQTRDGWIKLHTNLPHHRNAALTVLQCAPDRDSVLNAISTRLGVELETNIVATGGVAATMRTREQWRNHPQGQAIAKEPLIDWDTSRGTSRDGQLKYWQPTIQRPLNGVKVLDLTRVLAGPVATRTLAGFGADVLRIDPPQWDEPYVVPDITLGKRCASLDLTMPSDRECFERLLAEADILVHGYRPGAMHYLGYGQKVRTELAPHLLEVSLCAYGWGGPWSHRRGFDSLVQMSCGIADSGMTHYNQQKPTPLPVQALDHATGYLMAAAAIRLLNCAVQNKQLGRARLSLARTAELLFLQPLSLEGTSINKPNLTQLSETKENTPWGPARRLKPAIKIAGTPMRWTLNASRLGSAKPNW